MITPELPQTLVKNGAVWVEAQNHDVAAHRGKAKKECPKSTDKTTNAPTDSARPRIGFISISAAMKKRR